MIYRSIVAAVAAGIVLVACGGLENVSSAQPSVGSHASTEMLPRAAEPGSLYISTRAGIAVYAGSPLKYTGLITKGISLPEGLAFNSRKDLFVAEQGANAVTVYHAGSFNLIRTLSARFTKTPFQVGVSPNGDVYVLSRSFVSLFAKGRQSGSKRLDVKPSAISIDSSGNVYVATFGAIDVFAPGGTKPVRTITQGVGRSWATGLDAAGNLYVSNSPTSGCGDIAVYKAATGALEDTITEGVCEPRDIAFDSQNNVYVVNFAPISVSVFSGTTHRLVKTITNGISEPASILFDPSGNLYVVNAGDPGNVVIYSPNANKPSQTLTDRVELPASLAWLP